MRQGGFSLVELVVVMGIAMVLIAIGTLQFNEYSRKNAIESQAKKLQADLLRTKADALLQRRDRAVTFSSSQYSIYSSSVTTAGPVQQVAVKNAISSDIAGQLVFEKSGLVTDPSMANRAICVGPSGNRAAVDSVVITDTQIRIGKWSAGNCEMANITLK